MRYELLLRAIWDTNYEYQGNGNIRTGVGGTILAVYQYCLAL